LRFLFPRCNPGSTLLIFPGTGSQQLQKLLSPIFLKRYSHQLAIPVQRRKDENGIALEFEEEQVAELSKVLSGSFVDMQLRTVIIIDDVVHRWTTNDAIKRAMKRKELD